MVTLLIRLDGQPVGETRTGAVPARGDIVTVEDNLRGRLRGTVVRVNHQFTDSGARRVDVFVPAAIIVDLETVR
ncbi:hypothetical protein [Polymorphospora lycopeni]|uniref:KOW domain-containing protein n=1 Tax=Polymorphospora lycopeni TaxID=3140240 RepID=A0ABV5CNP0_9ACTN